MWHPLFGESCLRLRVLTTSSLVVACVPRPDTVSILAHSGVETGVSSAPATVVPKREGTLSDGRRALRETRYPDALAILPQVISTSGKGRLELAQVHLETGEAAKALRVLRSFPKNAPNGVQARTLVALALVQVGEKADAKKLLSELTVVPAARRARLLLGELLLQEGKIESGRNVLLSLVDRYNSDAIESSDAESLGIVGRAAHLLRSPEDANELYNAANDASADSTTVQLWQAQLFLDSHDPEQAQQVLAKLLERAPDHAEALVWMAQAKLDEAMDFDAARLLAERALNVNPQQVRGHLVLAGLKLRNLEYAEAEAHIAKGLKVQENDLELLSMRAAVAFLRDDSEGFDEVRDYILARNPHYSGMYLIVAKYAEWEHRYERIVEMMRLALELDEQDAKARATLGINLIRLGQESEGVEALRLAFANDPFDRRVFNTLELFESTIAEDYESAATSHFFIRYPREERALLERYVPKWLEQGWQALEELYGFTPKAPVGVELYAKRSDFAIRTSGLPQTAIQGVCFGQTLATMTPREESFNLGMTLWHELSHVFHIQLSQSHVPRWLTEGLAEYETLARRAEWSRHLEVPLYRAHRQTRLPFMSRMNRAFSEAKSHEDMAVAYYASSQLATWLVETQGRARVREMLLEFSRGGTTSEVFDRVLRGSTRSARREQFQGYLSSLLKRYDLQFVPRKPRKALAVLRREAATAPSRAVAQSLWATAAWNAKAEDEAALAAQRTLELSANDPNALLVLAELSLANNEPEKVQALAARLVESGSNGFETQMLVAQAARLSGAQSVEIKALLAAHGFDPTRSVPPMRLWQLARMAENAVEEIRWLNTLTLLEPHQSGIFQRLLSLLVADKRYAEAQIVGESALFVDVESVEIHRLLARALAGLGEENAASFEFESALLCPASNLKLRDVHTEYSQFLESIGRTRLAEHHAEQADRLSSNSDHAPR